MEINNRRVQVSYTWGIKVVQLTVSYALGGRSLRDMNAKTKVAARAMMYIKPGGKRATANVIPANTSLHSLIISPKTTPIKMKMGTEAMEALDMRHSKSSS